MSGSGYQSAEYVAALAEIGQPLFLPRCDGWLLDRQIARTGLCDAVGCYPLFRCSHWHELDRDLEDLRDRVVSVALVVDPYGSAPADLSTCFPHVCRPFKEHFGIDFSRDWSRSIGSNHRRNIRAASRAVEVEHCAIPEARLDEWTALYGELIARHAVIGPARFSRSSFERQLRVPGIALFRATCGSETVAMSLWYLDGDVAYYHLGACNSRGYELAAMFAVFDVALRHFAEAGLRFAELGGAAGWRATTADGLARFKAGWANERRTAWFCGRVLDEPAYQRLATGRQHSQSGFFPGYRQPEAA
jgi:hypothetical protein